MLFFRPLNPSSKICLAFTSVAVFSATGISEQLFSSKVLASENEKFRAGEFIIKVSSSSALEKFAREHDLLFIPEPFLHTGSGDWYKLIDPESRKTFSELKVAAAVHDDIVALEPNHLWHAIEASRSENPNSDNVGPEPEPAPRLPKSPRKDPRLDEAWGIAQVAAPEAWKKTIGSNQVVVADIDTGIDYNHEDLVNNIWHNPREIPNDGIDNDGNGFIDDVVGWDFAKKDNRPWDDNGHGTHTSGSIGATGGNGKGVSGVAQRVSLMPVKFLDRTGSGSTDEAILSINYAVASGAQILSNSWGGDEESKALEDAIIEAGKKDVLFVAAAGNDGTNNDEIPMYPASYKLSNVIAVAASDRQDQLADFSNFGVQSVHLAAPGDGILSTLSQNRYGILSGTSMACPHVAGAAALLKSFKPTLKAVEIKDLLVRSVDIIPSYNGKIISGGRLNVARALAIASGNSQ